MKKIFKISLIALSALFLGACTLKPNSNDSAKSVKKMSLKELVTLNIPQKCTWTFEEEGNKTTGKILVKGKKFNQVSKITGPDGEMEFNSVSDGEYIYSWSNDPKTGGMAFKMKIEETETDTDAEGNIKMDWDGQYDFDCNPTILSDKDFTPPQGIEFIDMEDFTNNFKNSFSVE